MHLDTFLGTINDNKEKIVGPMNENEPTAKKPKANNVYVPVLKGLFCNGWNGD
jgi:hypothetical protein